ncbi:MAG: amino acid adenylation domain-containing protein, partial [Candidatus Aminicenantes bacterium]
MSNQQNHQLSLSQKEKAQILFEFNKTRREYPTDKTLHRLFADQVEKTPDRIALVGQSAGHCAITYRELNQKSHQLAYILKEKGLQPDTIVSIMIERSPQMIIGILGILKAGGAYLPIEPDSPQERIKYMLADSSANLLVTTGNLWEDRKSGNWEGEKIFLGNSPLERGAPEGRGVSEPAASPSNLAYVIYTSGSTGKPKGVMVEQRNVTNLVFGLKEKIYHQYHQNLRVCLVAPYGFDASVKQIFAALLLGYSLYIVPEDTRIDGLKLLEFYNTHAIDISDGTPTHIQLLLETLKQKGTDQAIAVKNFIIGGEPLSRETVEHFFLHLKTKDVKITNVYGPTECCVDSTSYQITPNNVRRYNNLPIGMPMPNQQVYILDQAYHLQPIGSAGELYIAGANVSRGYLNNPELTAEKYIKGTRGLAPLLYRSGDLAQWLPDGNIEFLGRIDYQVKIRGFRIELGEIENQLMKHDKIKEAVVVAKESTGVPENKYLCAYITTTNDTGNPRHLASQLRKYLSPSLPDYMIPSYFVRLDRIPFTPSGKIDRKSLPEPAIETSDNYEAPGNQMEEQLVKIWSKALGTVEKIIGIHDHFFEIGGHSLNAALMLARIHKHFNVRLTLADIFKTPTIKGLSTHIKKAAGDQYHSIDTIEKKEYYLLSSAQKRLYILDQMELASTSYNITAVYQLAEEPDTTQLENAFRQLIQRHESFRTSFIMAQDEPVQRIHDEVDFEIEYYSATENTKGTKGLAPLYKEPATSTIKNFIRHFDLSKPPLLRVGLIKIQNAKPLLLVDIHHIVSDGTSMDIFKKELTVLYHKKEFPPLKIQYKDYAQWQGKERQNQKFKNQEKYWLKEFEGEIPVLSLSTDFPRPDIQSFSGNTLYFELGQEQTGALNQLAAAEPATLFMILFAIFNILLAKLSGQENIVVGIPTAGRRHADLENIIGMFVNTLALKNFPSGEKKFNEFLAELKIKTLDAFENQEYQFEDLVELLNVTRDASRNPLFDVMFVLQNMEEKETRQPGLEITRCKYLNDTCKFDLTLITEEKEEGLSFDLGYCTRLFKEETIR